MRFFHLADLHFGKAIHGVSLLENGDQGYWVDQFLKLAEEQRPDAVVIAGDVYDRSAPSGDAVGLLSRMLTALSEMHIPVMMTAGNHDSAQRLSFAGSILARQGVHISAPLFGSPELEHVTLEDEYGPVTFWLMPYVFPTLIAQVLGEDTPRDNDGAVCALLERQKLDVAGRNVLVAHQNVTVGGAEAVRGGSETMVGGVGQIDYKPFDAFDYVALGHIHAACPVGRETVRYAGSPLCYHFNEIHQPIKGPLMVEIGAKGEAVHTELFPIKPLHPMREIRGTFEELRDQELANPRRGEYLRLVLTDCRLSTEITTFFDSLARERDSILMDRCSEYNPFAVDIGAPASHKVEQKNVSELFANFYEERSGGELPADKDMAFLRFAQELSQHADIHQDPVPKEIDQLLNYLLEQEGDA